MKEAQWLLDNPACTVSIIAEQYPSTDLEWIEWGLLRKVLVARCLEHKMVWTRPNIWNHPDGHFYVACSALINSEKVHHQLKLESGVLYLCVIRDGVIEWPHT